MKKILVLILCMICMVVSYFGTLYLDKIKNNGIVDITVTFDDTESYSIPNISKLTKEGALKEWPYIMHVENTGNARGLYQMLIKDIDGDVDRDVLEYSLYLDNQEVAYGKLSSLNNDILYTYSIDSNQKQEYKLYIWAINEGLEKYEYKIVFNTIKDFGPGF